MKEKEEVRGEKGRVMKERRGKGRKLYVKGKERKV